MNEGTSLFFLQPFVSLPLSSCYMRENSHKVMSLLKYSVLWFLVFMGCATTPQSHSRPFLRSPSKQPWTHCESSPFLRLWQLPVYLWSLWIWLFWTFHLNGVIWWLFVSAVKTLSPLFLAVPCGLRLVPRPGVKLRPQQWKCCVLTSGPPRNSPMCGSLCLLFPCNVHKVHPYSSMR